MSLDTKLGVIYFNEGSDCIPGPCCNMVVDAPSESIRDEAIGHAPPEEQWRNAGGQAEGETMLYWTGQNTFVVDVVDYDSTLLLNYVKFHCKCRYKNQLEKETGPRISCAGSIHWTNLQGWAKAIWSWDLGALQRSPSDDQEEVIIASALEIAEQHRGRLWEDCQQALDTLRKTIEGLSNVQIM
ncbi:hypothetical protein Slin15195_G071050 [Septoria linicola]|uniref:Uncharacterized protein n=1 Tax=Septoria linicola TaxID=215465 RepID=A0A9Q9B007_9PEZI|nr:hypothetical protein Slin15195_G071050 [Septoria linicola]